MARSLDVCIRGGGIVGHVLALLLARERLRVGLVSRPATAGPPDVRAYALNQRSRMMLEDLRCWPQPPDVTPVTTMDVQETGGAAVHFDALALVVPALAWIVDVPVLEAQLAQAVQFQPQIDLLDAPADATLTVVCEGRASASRALYGVEQDVMAYPQWAIATRLACEVAHQQAACQWFGPDDILGLLPMQGVGGNLMAAVWSIPSGSKDHWLEAPDEMFEEKMQTSCDNRFGRMRLASARAAWPLQRAVALRWCGVRAGKAWVLAGDAAHAVHPLAGQGLNLGLADARELARTIHERDYWRGVDDAKMLRRYERARKADVAVMTAATDGLQQLFGRTGGGWHGLRHWGMRGFDGSGMLKSWVARQAMGLSGDPHDSSGPPSSHPLTGPA
jgi:2-polyprenyl-6-methoxyphenol hydroxylase-like FAD-dependent oxidoreductase